jgi:hypothetical protein
MALGMNYDTSGGGDFLPIVKYDARAGRIFRVDRLDRVNNPVDITRSFKAVIDLENIEVGWLDFQHRRRAGDGAGTLRRHRSRPIPAGRPSRASGC